MSGETKIWDQVICLQVLHLKTGFIPILQANKGYIDSRSVGFDSLQLHGL